MMPAIYDTISDYNSFVISDNKMKVFKKELVFPFIHKMSKTILLEVQSLTAAMNDKVKLHCGSDEEELKQQG